MSCGVGHRHGSDPALLGLWSGPAATAPIWPLVREPPCAVGVALKKKKKWRIKYGMTISLPLAAPLVNYRLTIGRDNIWRSWGVSQPAHNRKRWGTWPSTSMIDWDYFPLFPFKNCPLWAESSNLSGDMSPPSPRIAGSYDESNYPFDLPLMLAFEQPNSPTWVQ